MIESKFIWMGGIRERPEYFGCHCFTWCARGFDRQTDAVGTSRRWAKRSVDCARYAQVWSLIYAWLSAGCATISDITPDPN